MNDLIFFSLSYFLLFVALFFCCFSSVLSSSFAVAKFRLYALSFLVRAFFMLLLLLLLLLLIFLVESRKRERERERERFYHILLHGLLIRFPCFIAHHLHHHERSFDTRFGRTVAACLSFQNQSTSTAYPKRARKQIPFCRIHYRVWLLI